MVKYQLSIQKILLHSTLSIILIAICTFITVLFFQEENRNEFIEVWSNWISEPFDSKLDIIIQYMMILSMYYLCYFSNIYIITKFIRYDKTTILTIDPETWQAVYSREEKTLEFNMKDIEDFRYISCFFRGKVIYYNRLKLKSGEILRITCFVFDDLDEYVMGEYKIDYRWFPEF